MYITRRTGLKGLIAGATSVAMPALVRADEPEIIVGAPNSLTGGLGEIGQRMTWGLQIAIDQVNREGGIKSLGGAKLKAIIADTTSENPTQAASVTRRIIDQDKAIVLAGATASATTLAATVESEKSEIPIVTNSYADGIVTRGYKYTFKITPQGGPVWNWSMSSGYEMWKASKGSPPKSALIFMSNDAVGLVVQKQRGAAWRRRDCSDFRRRARGLGFGRTGVGRRGRSLLRADGVELGPQHARQQGVRGGLPQGLSKRALPAGERAARSGLRVRDDYPPGAREGRESRP